MRTSRSTPLQRPTLGHSAALGRPAPSAMLVARAEQRHDPVQSALAILLAALLALALSWSLSARTAEAQGLRIPHALLIANEDYDDLPRVSGALRQGRDLAFELRALGYRVTRLENVNQADLIAGVGDFFAGSQDAPQRLVFYSGHTLSVDQTTYLLPSDAAIANPFDLYRKALNLDALVAALSAGRAPGALLVNGGYDHALAGDVELLLGDGASLVSAALSQPQGRDDVVVLFAQSGGQLTSASGGQLFVNLFLASLVRDGRMDLMEALSTLASSVAQRSNGDLRPQLSLDYVSTTTLAGQPSTGGAPTGGFAGQAEQDAWNLAQSSNTLAGYDAYLADYPGGVFAAQARQERAALYDSYGLRPINETYITKRTSNTRQGPGTNFPKVDTLSRDTQVRVLGRVSGQSWYMIELPNGSQAFVYATLIEPAATSEFVVWQEVDRSGDLAALDDFLQRFPNGRFADQARQQRAAIFAAELDRRLAALRITRINQLYFLEREALVYNFPSRRDGTSLGRFNALQKLTVVGAVSGTAWFEVEIRGGRGFMERSDLQAYAGSDFEAWEQVQANESLRALRAFLRNFPGSPFAGQAQARLDALTPSEPAVILINKPFYTLQAARLRATPSRDGDILDTISGNVVLDAVSMTADRSWIQVRVRTSASRREGYIFANLLAEYQGSDLQAWRALGDNPTERELRNFLRDFPDSQFRADAEARLAAMSGGSSPDAETPMDALMVTNRATRVFAEANRRSPILLSLNDGVRVRVVAQVVGRDWVRVRVRSGGGRVEGYVRFSHLSDEAPTGGSSGGIDVIDIAPEIRVITQDGTKLLDAPGGNQVDIGRRLLAQDAIQVDGKTSDGKWYRAEVNGRAVYVQAVLTADYLGSERKDWDDVLQRNSRQGFEFYLRKWPRGRWVNEARAAAQRLQVSPLEDLVDELFDQLKKQ